MNAPSDSPTVGTTLSMQPLPTVTFLSRLSGVTAIGRRWEPGDTRLCRLCPQCTADHEINGCLIQTEDAVRDEDAPSYSSWDGEWVPPPPVAGDGDRLITREVPVRLAGLSGSG